MLLQMGVVENACGRLKAILNEVRGLSACEAAVEVCTELGLESQAQVCKRSAEEAKPVGDRADQLVRCVCVTSNKLQALT